MRTGRHSEKRREVQEKFAVQVGTSTRVLKASQKMTATNNLEIAFLTKHDRTHCSYAQKEMNEVKPLQTQMTTI
jgi:hypothetical protein